MGPSSFLLPLVSLEKWRRFRRCATAAEQPHYWRHMPTCAVNWCKHRNDEGGPRFFRFPTDYGQRVRWIIRVEREDLYKDEEVMQPEVLCKKDLRACEHHFRPEDIEVKKTYAQLRKGALPFARREDPVWRERRKREREEAVPAETRQQQQDREQRWERRAREHVAREFHPMAVANSIGELNDVRRTLPVLNDQLSVAQTLTTDLQQQVNALKDQLIVVTCTAKTKQHGLVTSVSHHQPIRNPIGSDVRLFLHNIKRMRNWPCEDTHKIRANQLSASGPSANGLRAGVVLCPVSQLFERPFGIQASDCHRRSCIDD